MAGNADVQVGDTLLLEGAPEDITRLADDMDLVDITHPKQKAYRRNKAPIAIGALLFVVAVGLGPFAGVLALWVHTTGVLAKLFSEIGKTFPLYCTALGNVLVGGSANSIALQPLSVQGQVGVSVAAGLESLELRPGR